MPDKLVNRHPRVKFGGLHPFGVIRGRIDASRGGWGEGPAFTTPPSRPADAVLCSALWRGYVATFVLQDDGRLRLTAFDHLVGLWKWRRQAAEEMLAGDFWLVMKPKFFGPRTYIPFRDGVVVEDPAQWVAEERGTGGGRGRRAGGPRRADGEPRPGRAAEPGRAPDRGGGE